MYCVYGAGVMGRRFIEELISKDFSVHDFFVVDSDSSKWGKDICGICVEAPKGRFPSNDIDRIVISVANDDAFNNIRKMLIEEFSFSDKAIIRSSEAVILSCNPNMRNFKYGRGHRILSNSELLDELRSNLKGEELSDLERYYLFGQHRLIIKDLHYFEAYEKFFEKYRHKADVKILEIGVAGGGSMQMWKEYFKKFGAVVQVYGVDVDEKCKEYEEPGIKIYIGSQEDRRFLNELKKDIGSVDIVIDDGGHTMNQQIVSFEELFPIVSSDGVYLCEDTGTSFMPIYGGGYRGKSFIDYSKRMVDGFYKDTIDDEYGNAYDAYIKSISYYSGLVFIEKKEFSEKNVTLRIQND